MFLMPLLFAMNIASAEITDSGTLKFDHSKTGFSLAGSHIQARCASCHVDGIFKGTPRDCASCHVAGNRMGALSKTTKHIPTVAQCDRCHQTTAWVPATFSHVGLATGTCQNCHNGTAATGKPSMHMPTTDSCDGCHKTIDWKQLTAGGTLPANHLPTTRTCSLCHNQSSFIPGTMNHSGIFTGCVNCHSGQTFAVGMTPMSKASSHALTSLDCSNCHPSTVTFSMANLANLTTPPLGHLPTTQPCSTCHSSFGPGSGIMTHTIATGCTNCHNGQVFTGVTPKSKPVNHLPSSMTCETCHSTSNFTTFSGTTMKHTGIIGGCTNCHNGQSFAGVTPVSKPVGTPPHLPTNMSCETCHSTSNTNPGGFGNTLMKHTGIVSGCASCHGYINAAKSFAVGMTPVNQTPSPTHIAAGSSPCESCHSSTVSFTIAINGTKPTNHLPTTQPCSTCHSSTSYYPGIMNHLGIVSGCTTCHNGQVFAGVTPVSKPVNHLPTSGGCENCHVPGSTASGGFANGVMNHVGIAGGCTNCHNGQAFAGITPKTKPSNHIPYATSLLGGASMVCELCHKSTVFTAFTSLNSNSIQHNGSMGNGSGWCKTCHLSGTNYLGVTGSKMVLNHRGVTPTPTDCSQSGCHRPLGGIGSTYTNWN